MNKDAIHPRLSRLQRECEVSAAPAILLFAACSVIGLVLGLSVLMGEITPAQAG